MPHRHTKGIDQQTTPIVITQHSGRNPRGLMGYLAFIIFGVIAYPAIASAGGGPALVLVLVMCAGLGVGVYFIAMGKKLTIATDSLSYKDPHTNITVRYQDIERVGFNYSPRSGTGRVGVGMQIPVRRVRILVKGAALPATIDLSFFSDDNQLLVLDTLAKRAPQALFGDTLVSILATREFPTPPPATFSTFGRTIDETHFDRLPDSAVSVMQAKTYDS